MLNLVQGRIVHYKDYDQSRGLLCISAIVTRVVERSTDDGDKGIVHLQVFYSTDIQSKMYVPYGASEDRETWHWPQRV